MSGLNHNELGCFARFRVVAAGVSASGICYAKRVLGFLCVLHFTTVTVRVQLSD